MCQVIGYRSRICGHRWLTITKPCRPGVGFTTHPRHEFKGRTSFFGGPKYYDASANTCPNCDLKGQYNGNTTRMVLASGERECERRARLFGTIPYTNQRATPPMIYSQPVAPIGPGYGTRHNYAAGYPGNLAGYGGFYPIAFQGGHLASRAHGYSNAQAYVPAGYILPR